MNNARRKLIDKLIIDIEQAISELDTIHDDELTAFDGMPESLQNGEKGEKAQEAISNLEDAYSSLQSARDSLENAKE